MSGQDEWSESSESDETDPAVFLGTHEIWGSDTRLFGLCRADRRQHLYTIGKTGTGKSTLLRNLILQDIESGEGVGLIDPHGDLADDILDHIPPHRTDDVVYFNPADLDFPLSFNLLANVPEQERPLVASGIVSAFKHIWRDSWGPRLEYLLYAAAAALLECQNASLLGIQRMLVDRFYREWVLRQVTDPMVRSFWLGEFASYDRHFLSELISPVQNKVGQLLMSPPLRNILGQVQNRVDLRFVMDDRRIFIANLSKGTIGADKSNLLGSILVSRFELAAMSRATIPEDERQDFYLYIDEFHNFSTDSFASILSEARKYRLNLTLSHQYVDQVVPEIRDAVFGNVGSLMVFRVGDADAKHLTEELGSIYPPRVLTGLSNYELCARLLVNGVEGDAFLGRSFPPFGRRYDRRHRIISRSRERFAGWRPDVENKINRWLRLH